ncbi:MAG TPA: N-acetylmuramoyl-L-alanine amidase [Acidimicrobiia bacterium]
MTRSHTQPIILITLLALIIQACTSASATPPISQVTGSTVAETATTSTSAAMTTTTTEGAGAEGPTGGPPAPVAALITATGVIVAVLEDSSFGYRVRTPCGNEAIVASGEEIGIVDVVLDPGHGGSPDPGAVGANGLKEADVNLRVARNAQRVLENRGVVVALTRTADYTSPLGVRALFADHVGAELMVSIHHNAPTANLGPEPGTEVFVQHETPESSRLGGLLYEEAVEAFEVFDGVVWSKAPDAGVLEVLNTRGTDAYGMLRSPETVSALVELAYISHRSEAELLTTEEYVSAAGLAVADAISAYLDTNRLGRGYVAEPRVFTPQRGISAAVCEDPDFG